MQEGWRQLVNKGKDEAMMCKAGIEVETVERCSAVVSKLPKVMKLLPLSQRLMQSQMIQPGNGGTPPPGLHHYAQSLCRAPDHRTPGFCGAEFENYWCSETA